MLTKDELLGMAFNPIQKNYMGEVCKYCDGTGNHMLPIQRDGEKHEWNCPVVEAWFRLEGYDGP